MLIVIRFDTSLLYSNIIYGKQYALDVSFMHL